jgi:hypothetical protein
MTTLLALSTQVKPAKKFTVDGEEFQLLGTDHLSPSDEATAIALFSRHTLLAQELELTVNVVKGKAVAERLRNTRIQILCKLTDMPQEVADKLPTPEQVKLLEALQDEMVPDEDPDEAIEEDDAS